jgi:hypothetical protein
MEEEFFIPKKEQALIQMRLDLYRASVEFYQGTWIRSLSYWTKTGKA